MANMGTRTPSAAGQRVYEDIVPPHELTQGNDADTFKMDVTGMNFLFLFFFIVTIKYDLKFSHFTKYLFDNHSGSA
jgi:hypothetical protein